jgi:hypothetical protein
MSITKMRFNKKEELIGEKISPKPNKDASSRGR